MLDGIWNRMIETNLPVISGVKPGHRPTPMMTTSVPKMCIGPGTTIGVPTGTRRGDL